MSRSRTIVRRRHERRQRARSGARGAASLLVTAALVVAGVVFLAGLVVIGAAVSAYAAYSELLPDPGHIQLTTTHVETTRLYDRTGQHVIYEIVDPSGGEHSWVSLSNIPLDLRNATIALEDKSFYQNPGYDAQGIARAVSIDLLGGRVQGGSSITQQLVKNVLIDPSERSQVSLDRKIKELILSIRVSQKYSKDQILEWYLNTNFYGNLAYGVEAASEVYFGKPVNELNLAEAAMLAAIPQSPALNPIDNYDQAKARQEVVLDSMAAQGLITQSQADAAASAPLEIKSAEQRFNLLAPHFSVAARKQLEDILGPDLANRGGLVVYTTLDYPLYLQAECVARTHVARLSGRPPDTVIPAEDGSPCWAAQMLRPPDPSDQNVDHHVDNAAVVVLDAPTGEVLVMMGSLDYYNPAIDGQFNVAQAVRQPGSAIKPFTYLTAFQQGYTPATMTLDVRTAFDVGSNQPYVPENFDRKFHGPVSIRTALANSYNVPAVQVITWVGIGNMIRTAHALGITTLDRGVNAYGPSITLGGGDVTLVDMAYAFSVLANMGVMRGRPVPLEQRRPGFRTLEPTLILRVEDSQGDILWEYGKGNTFNSAPVVEPSLVYLLNDILSDDQARQPSVGPNSVLTLDRQAAVKTGTTNDYRDNWTIGYTPQIVTGVWVGNTDNSPMNTLPALAGAAPIWQAVMQVAQQGLPKQTWQRPDDIAEVTVCQPSGLLPTPYCPTRQEIFKKGTEPKSPDDIYLPFQINKDTGLLATVYTPPDKVEQRIYEVLPPEAADWMREAGIPQPPSAYDTVNAPTPSAGATISSPKLFSYVRGLVSVQGTARDAAFRAYRLDYGQGLNPSQWFQIGADQPAPVTNGELGLWDTTGLDGLYSLRLTVVRSDNTIQQYVMQVTVDNIPPSAQLLYPDDGQQFHMSDEYLQIQPAVSDNVSMDRVEFYVDNTLIATSTVSPYNERWTFKAPGRYLIQVRAFDAAGNTTASNPVTVDVLP